jgi:hypothetical protein
MVLTCTEAQEMKGLHPPSATQKARPPGLKIDARLACARAAKLDQIKIVVTQPCALET